ncbi:reverse transcriptase [Tanacetum coccineum]
MSAAPVLKLPNFDELFVIETNASHTGIRVVLQQGGHPVAYYSKSLVVRHQTHSTYDKELLAVIQALNKWRGITTPSQMKWLPKLMGFDYDILYKKGSENKAADALSRIPTSAQLLNLVCQTNKPDLSAYPGLLQPLPIPKLVWSEISMDFIEGLPFSYGKTVIFVVVDRLREKPKTWSKWVSLAEYWYNTSYHTYINTTPYEVLYDQPPPNPIAYVQGRCLVDAVDRTLAAREAMIQLMHFHLTRAQDRMKAIVDAKRTDREFECNDDGELVSVLMEVLDRRLGKVGNAAQVFVLIRWSNGQQQANGTEKDYFAITDLCATPDGSSISVVVQGLPRIMMLSCNIFAKTLCVLQMDLLVGDPNLTTVFYACGLLTFLRREVALYALIYYYIWHLQKTKRWRLPNLVQKMPSFSFNYVDGLIQYKGNIALGALLHIYICDTSISNFELQ